MEEKNIDSRVYEVGYLLVPTLSEEEMPAIYSSLKDTIASLGGEFISDEMPKMINLAYTMNKTIQNVKNRFDNAYFGWVKFFMDAEKVLELKKKLDLNPQVIRFLIVKTVKENTIAAKKFTNRDNTRRKPFSAKREDVEEALPINKEEVDKEIDAMVAE